MHLRANTYICHDIYYAMLSLCHAFRQKTPAKLNQKHPELCNIETFIFNSVKRSQQELDHQWHILESKDWICHEMRFNVDSYHKTSKHDPVILNSPLEKGMLCGRFGYTLRSSIKGVSASKSSSPPMIKAATSGHTYGTHRIQVWYNLIIFTDMKTIKFNQI